MVHFFNTCKYFEVNFNMYGIRTERCTNEHAKEMDNRDLFSKIFSFIFGHPKGCRARYRFESCCPLYEHRICNRPNENYTKALS